MKIEPVCQRTPEWFHWRKNGVTSSEAAVVLGLCPYKTVWRLWAEKTGRCYPPDLSRNPNVIRGIAKEDTLRRLAEDRVANGDLLLPVCGEHSQNPKAKSSYDGIDSQGIPSELKCPSHKTWIDVIDNKCQSKAYKFYYPQVQHQIYVADAPYGYLLFLDPSDDNNCKVFKVARDEEFILKLISAIDTFMDYVTRDEPPPDDQERDIFVPVGDVATEWIYEAQKYRSLTSEIEEIEKKLSELKSRRDIPEGKMAALMGNYRIAEFAGVRIVKYFRKGSVCYEKLIDDSNNNISKENIESYRSESTECLRLTVTERSLPEGYNDSEYEDILNRVHLSNRRSKSHL